MTLGLRGGGEKEDVCCGMEVLEYYTSLGCGYGPLMVVQMCWSGVLRVLRMLLLSGGRVCGGNEHLLV